MQTRTERTAFLIYGKGISLVELLIAIALGLIVTAAVSAVFLNSSRSFKELQKSSEQIENGRFAMSLIAEDVRHAGFYGQICNFDATKSPACNAPAWSQTLATTDDPVVDPCAEITDANHRNVLSYPVQFYAAANFTSAPATRPSCLAASELKAGSDILVIRRVDTVPLVPGTSGTVSGVKYLQANPTASEIQTGNGATYGVGKKADGTAATILNRDGTAAPIRRIHVSIYYVSPCSQVACGNGSDQIPTLKRMDMATGVGTPTWTTLPLVAGIEHFKVDLGIDTLPATINIATQYKGDGAADGDFVRALPAQTSWNDVVSLRIHLLARTLDSSPGHSDSGMTYTLGAAGAVSPADAFKRHVFSSEVRLHNVSMRRERIVGDGTSPLL